MDKKTEVILLKIGRNQFKRVNVNNICLLGADNVYTTVKLSCNDSFLATEPLKQVEIILSIFNNFCRINRSTIVNLDFVSEFTINTHPVVLLENKEKFKVTGQYKENFLKKITYRNKK